MDSVLLRAMRQMEWCDWEVLDGHGATCARRAAVYTGGGTPSFDGDYLSVEPVFDTDADDLDDGPVFDTYLANLDDALVFDADLADGPVFDADPGDLDDGPVFDTEPLPGRVAAPMCELAKSELNVFDQGLDDLSSARVNTSLDEGLLLAEKHTQVEVASSFGTWVIFSSNVAVPATTVATPSMCSPKCLHRAVHAEKTLVIKPLQEFEGQQHDFFSTDLWLDACAGLCSRRPGVCLWARRQGAPGAHVHRRSGRGREWDWQTDWSVP
jgi:hypothetical protein